MPNATAAADVASTPVSSWYGPGVYYGWLLVVITCFVNMYRRDVEENLRIQDADIKFQLPLVSTRRTSNSSQSPESESLLPHKPRCDGDEPRDGPARRKLEELRRFFRSDYFDLDITLIEVISYPAIATGDLALTLAKSNGDFTSQAFRSHHLDTVIATAVISWASWLFQYLGMYGYAVCALLTDVSTPAWPAIGRKESLALHYIGMFHFLAYLTIAIALFVAGVYRYRETSERLPFPPLGDMSLFTPFIFMAVIFCLVVGNGLVEAIYRQLYHNRPIKDRASDKVYGPIQFLRFSGEIDSDSAIIFMFWPIAVLLFWIGFIQIPFCSKSDAARIFTPFIRPEKQHSIGDLDQVGALLFGAVQLLGALLKLLRLPRLISRKLGQD